MNQMTLGVRLRDAAIFESFAPGCNVELLDALRNSDSTPLWLWGAAGTGKTHLLQAVCAAAAETAAYLPLNRTASLPADALQGFESCRVLCLDDVDAVAGDLDWEKALFRLFNDAAELRTRLVLAGGVAPRQVNWVLGDWRSRTAACLVYQVRDLDDAGRVEALRLRAAQRGLQLPLETSDYLLRRMPRDLASLFAMLDRIDEASLIAQRRLTVPFIRDVLKRLAETKS